MMIAKAFSAVLVLATSLYVGALIDFSIDHRDGSALTFIPLQYSLDDYFSQNSFLDLKTRSIIDAMTAEEKSGQLLMPAYEKNISPATIKKWIKDYKLGGFMILRNDLITEDVQDIKDYFNNIESTHKLPLFISIDAEPSLIKNRLPGYFDELRTEDLTIIGNREAASDISSLLSEYGINLNFAPVYDSNMNRSVIGNRSYGLDSLEITPLAADFSDISKAYNVIPTAKHFPGHGSVSGDTHYSLQSVASDLPELDQFSDAINDQALFMMIGHLAIDGGIYGTKGVPATLSKKISSDLLQKEMGFEGVIISDGLNMGALNTFENSSQSIDMQALDAGIDILLMTRTLDQTFNNVVRKIKSDPEFSAEIDKKLYKIVRMKLVWQWAESKK